MASSVKTQFPILSILIAAVIFSGAASSSVHDLLRSMGLPAGLFPREVRSFSLSGDGRLEVVLAGPCLTEFENRFFFDRVVAGNLSYGELTGVEGLAQEELFLWLPVKDIVVDDPRSGVIVFDIGVARKQFSMSLFEDPPDCGTRVRGGLKNHGRKEKGFESMR